MTHHLAQMQAKAAASTDGHYMSLHSAGITLLHNLECATKRARWGCMQQRLVGGLHCICLVRAFSRSPPPFSRGPKHP